MDDRIYLVILIICMLVSIVAAFIMNDLLRKKHPGVKSYVWGYYMGWMGALAGTVGGVRYIVIFSTYGSLSDAMAFMVLEIFCLVFAIAHVFIVKRNKWAWIVGTLLQLNPITWVINGIYLKNRWVEMGGLPIERWSEMEEWVEIKRWIQIMRHKFASASLINRAFVAGSVFWILVVLAFIFMFEPYGRGISNSEWRQIIKIIVFPPVVLAAGYFLYVKVVKQKDRSGTPE